MAQPVPITAREGDATIQRRRSNAQMADRAHRLLVDQVLLVLEESSLAGESRLQIAGKGAYRQALEDHPDPSHAGAAQSLLDAITGYLFRAWRQGSGELTPSRLREFRGRVRDGIEQGAGETRRLLQVLSRRSIATDHALLRTLDLLHARLDRWFRSQDAFLAPTMANPSADRR